MRIVISGATGLVGRALVLHRLGRGDHVTAWVRDVNRARALLGPDVELVAVDDAGGLGRAIADADAVVHLAGEPIVGKRWTAKRKRALVASRTATADAIVAAIRARQAPLPVLVSASAVGYYGDRGDAELTEHAEPGNGFAAELCAQWEQAARAAAGAAARVVCARLGIVLARSGGALAPLARLARLGLAGPIGGGAQWVPWIHIDDAVRAIGHAIDTPSITGAINVVAPAPVRQRSLVAALGKILSRPVVLPVPRLALRAVLGEAASVLLVSQRALPAALVRTGFRFTFGTLPAALDDLLRDPRSVAIRSLRRGEIPASPYLSKRRPRYLLRARTVLERPLEEVLAFFARAENLSIMTPPDLELAIETPTPIAMAEGSIIDYRIKLLGAPMRWRTEIERWDSDRSFVDVQLRGPYRAWWHEHRFARDGARTIMEDLVYYAPPAGLLGRIANRLLVAPMLRKIFAYRRSASRRRFGAA